MTQAGGGQERASIPFAGPLRQKIDDQGGKER
jgi:hypothetical protein